MATSRSTSGYVATIVGLITCVIFETTVRGKMGALFIMVCALNGIFVLIRFGMRVSRRMMASFMGGATLTTF